MSTQTIVLQVPEMLYQRLQQRAEQKHRTLEAELLDVLASASPAADELPTDLEAALSPLTLLGDEDLWRAARHQLPTEVATDLEELHRKRQREGLTETETQALAYLVRQYERNLLVRAQAAALLKQRGHDVSSLAVLP